MSDSDQERMDDYIDRAVDLVVGMSDTNKEGKVSEEEFHNFYPALAQWCHQQMEHRGGG